MKIRLLYLIIASANGFAAHTQTAGPVPLPAQIIEANAEKELLDGPDEPKDFPA